MLRKIDDTIIAGHQWIVDMVQKQPRWCAEQALYAIVVIFLVRCGLDESPIWVSALILPVYLLMFWMTRRVSADRLASLSHVRFMTLVFLSFNLVFLFVDTADIQTRMIILRIANDVSLTMFYYFLACHPPRPRVRKPRLVPSTSST